MMQVKHLLAHFAVGYLLSVAPLGTLLAQVSYFSNSKRGIRHYERSVAHTKKKDVARAIRGFQRTIAADENFIEAHIKLAELYAQRLEEGKKVQHLEEVLRIAPQHVLATPVYFALGEWCYRAGGYERAKSLLEHYLKKGRNNEHISRAKKYLLNITFALQAIENPVDFTPVKLPAPLNEYPMQYFASLNATEDKIVFTMRKGHHVEDDEDIYSSEKDPKTNAWSKPKPLSAHVNTADYNEGSSIISADGKLIVLTSCQRPDGKGSCDLYTSRYINGHWQSPQHIPPPINTRHWESQPALSADKKTLYFVSDRPGGVGKRDIWYATRLPKGKWSNPRSMGTPINTEGDDISPFVHHNGAAIYFASNGHMGMGGYDLYLSEKDSNGAWTLPKNLGYPINNHKDEVSLFVNAAGTHGYYTDEKVMEDGTYESYLYKFSMAKENQVGRRHHATNTRVPSVPKSEKKYLPCTEIFFATNSHRLGKTDLAALRKVAVFLKERKVFQLQLDGHTDNTGRETYNQWLSTERARAVYNFLLSQGVQKDSVTYTGHGAKQPQHPNNTSENRKKNRRVVLLMAGQTKK